MVGVVDLGREMVMVEFWVVWLRCRWKVDLDENWCQEKGLIPNGLQGSRAPGPSGIVSKESLANRRRGKFGD